MNSLSYECQDDPCPLCGEGRYRIYLKSVPEWYNRTLEPFDIVQCEACRFCYTNPRPTPETMSVFYPEQAGYYQPTSLDEDITSWLKSSSIRAVLTRDFGYPTKTDTSSSVSAGRRWLLRRRLFLNHIPHWVPHGRLLDIGCSWGGYLLQTQALGWEGHGVELSAAAGKIARERLGHERIHIGGIEDFPGGESSFDVVHMSMVLEHLYQPLAVLKQIRNLLKPGGQFIVSVPDITGWEARLYGRYAYTLHVPSHLNHFSPSTLQRALDQAGFSRERIIYQQMDRDMVAPSSYMSGSLLKRILHLRWFRRAIIKPLVLVLSLFHRTSRMSFYARTK